MLAHGREPGRLRALAVHCIERPVRHQRARGRRGIAWLVVDARQPDMFVVVLCHQPHHVVVGRVLGDRLHLRDVHKAHTKLAQLVGLTHRLYRSCNTGTCLGGWGGGGGGWAWPLPLMSSTSPNGRKRSTTLSPLFFRIASASQVESTMITAATPWSAASSILL